MCGIAGVSSRTLNLAARERLTRSMLDTLADRGPDEAAIGSLGSATFGVARLTIVGGWQGAQPSFRDERSALALNGELFNHRDVALAHGLVDSHSDTAVVHDLLDLDSDLLFEQDGQFSLAYAIDGTVTLARDRSGILPLYYLVDGSDFFFASSIEALRATSRTIRLDPSAAFAATVLWGSPSSRSVYDAVAQVPRGGQAIWNEANGDLTVRRFIGANSRGAKAIDAALVEWRLRKAVDARIPTDVPYACLVSGGLDSAAIAAIACQSARRPNRAYGLVFDDEALNEGVFQEAVCERLDLELRQIRVSAADLAETFVQAVRSAEAPLLRTASVSNYLLAQAIHRDGLRVVLSGEGADEYFGGYELFKVTSFRSQWDGQINSFATEFFSHLEGLPGERRAIEPAYYAKYLDTQSDPFFSHRIRWTATGANLARLLVADRVRTESQAYLDYLLPDIPQNFSDYDLLDRARFLEVETFLQSSLLGQQSDRMFMANSVECRYPFLAPQVLDAALVASWSQLVASDWREKAVLKDAVAGLVPPTILNRTKQAFAAPTTSMFRCNEGREIFGELFDRLDRANVPWIKNGAVPWMANRVMGSSRLSTYDEISALWLCSISVLLASE